MAIVEDSFPPRTTPTKEQIDKRLIQSQSEPRSSPSPPTEHGRALSASNLVAPDRETILLTHWNISHIDHAELCLARLAAAHYSQSYLWNCILYTAHGSFVPCAPEEPIRPTSDESFLAASVHSY
ncbi:hypothetical protein BBP40_009434 [Aspergillus hancockii]|nr:hypothetical protein BBP40_009434 [Aspergillus hancockii]